MFDDLLTISDEHGRRLRVIVDEPESAQQRGTVVLAPVFGATAQSMFPFAYSLVVNGFRVLRPDFRDHVGLSDGTIHETTLSSQVVDLVAVIEPDPDIVLVAVSLSCRPAIRAAGSFPRLRGLVLVTPVIDVASTIREVTGDDFFAVPSEKLPSEVEILDYRVSTGFILDAQADGFDDLAGSTTDLLAVSSPIRLIVGDADPWVSHSDVVAAANVLTADAHDVQVVTIPAASHRLNRNPVVAARYVETTTSEALGVIGVNDEPLVPTFDETMRAVSETRDTRKRLLAGMDATADA